MIVGFEYIISAQVAIVAMAVAYGEQRRKKEAMDILAAEIAKGGEDTDGQDFNSIGTALKSVIERGWMHRY